MHFNQFFFFSLLCETFANMNSVPVFLVDNEKLLSFPNAPINPFDKLSSLEFMEVLQLVKKRSSSVIVFAENEFCIEDISGKDQTGTPYYHLRQGFKDHTVKYYPSVTNPYELLNQLFRQHDYNKFYLKHKTTKLPIYDKRYKYFYVFFEDSANETRVESLRRHDSIMNEVCLVIRQFHTGPVLAFYTGRINPMLLTRRKLVPLGNPPKYKKFVNKYSMVKLGGLSILKDGTRWPLTNKIKNVTEVYDSENKILLLKLFINNFELLFNFKMNEKIWSLNSITWTLMDETIGHKNIDLGAPWHVSFKCNEPIYIDNTRDKSILIISNYQLEVIKEWLEGKVTDKRDKFLSFVDCQPYFNSAIVMCLCITFLCIAILMYGILMVMSCESNDRYDDPQSLPLTIAER